MGKAIYNTFLKRCFRNFSSLKNVSSSYLRPCPQYELLLNLLGNNSLTTKAQFLTFFVNLGNVTLAKHTEKNQFFLHLIPVLGELNISMLTTFTT